MGTGHYLFFQTLSHHQGCPVSTGHIHPLESWVRGSWGSEGPSLDSNQGDLSGFREGQELPAGPDSVIFTAVVSQRWVSKIREDGGWAWCVQMCEGKESGVMKIFWGLNFSRILFSQNGFVCWVRTHLQL